MIQNTIPLDVEEVEAVIQADDGPDHDAVSAMPLRRPLAGAVRGILKEVDPVPEPVVDVPTDAKAVAKHVLGGYT
ncbi:MAG: hypothetical protein U0893_25835 [Chloroflexota bacterium]